MRRCLPILVVFILALPFSVVTACYASVTNPYAPLSTPVNHSMTVRVSIIGISDIDLNQLLWNLEPEIRPSIQTNHSPQGFSPLNWGTSFTMKYDINSVSTSAASNLKSYLKSIAKTETVPDYLQGSQPDSNRYTTLDALKTEDWLNTHISDFGGIPDDGYLLIVADLSDISNLYHYYSISYNDLDKASSQATNAGDPTLFPIVDWMFSWGGHHRFYFIDLSGGDPDFDYTQTGHVPIQDFDVRTISNQQVRFSKNGQTVTEYVADYIAEATRNLFLPDYAYAPTYATSYRIVVNLFDETGQISDTNVGNYLSTSMMKQAYEAFIPYASWDVSVTTHQLRDDAGLAKAVSDSLAFTRSTGSRGATSSIDYYDYRQVYFYLQSHMGQYVDAKGDTIVLPIFEFVFKNGARFEQSIEESIGSSSRNIEFASWIVRGNKPRRLIHSGL